MRAGFYAPAALATLAAFVIAFPAEEWPVPMLWGWYGLLGWCSWRLASGALARASAIALIVAYVAAFLLALTR